MLSENTIKIHIPQHVLFFGGLVSLLMGYTSLWWLLVTYGFWFVIGYVGYSIWYHRYFAHRSFKTSRLWENVWAYVGLLCGRGTPLNIASLHMAEHHPYADTEKDPHSPAKGIWWSWFAWAEHHEFKASPKHIKHLLRNDFVKWLSANYFKVYWGTFILLCLFDWRLGVLGLMGAGVLQYHLEGIVSTFCHLPSYGTQDHPTKDNSRNIRGLFNIITWGTGLHNNHHYRPGQYHYEIDERDFDLAKYIVPLFIKKD